MRCWMNRKECPLIPNLPLRAIICLSVYVHFCLIYVFPSCVDANLSLSSLCVCLFVSLPVYLPVVLTSVCPSCACRCSTVFPSSECMLVHISPACGTEPYLLRSAYHQISLVFNPLSTQRLSSTSSLSSLSRERDVRVVRMLCIGSAFFILWSL